MNFPKRILLVIPIIIIAVIAYLSWPRTTYVTATVVREPIVEEAFASGNVQAPTTADLSFKTSGKLVALPVKVGQHVAAGQVLAREDTTMLEAELAQATANIRASKAVLASLQNGATPEAVAVATAGLATAKQSLANTYASVGSTLADASAKANDAVTNQLARFFTNGNTTNPALTFTVSDFGLANRIVTERSAANTALAALVQMPAGGSPAALDTALAAADTEIASLQSLLADAVAAASASTGLSTSDAATYRAAASAGLAEVNAALAEVEALEHAIALAKAAAASAQASLDLTTASSTATSIDAQTSAVAAAEASADAIVAQIRDLEIVAPAAGIVTDTNGTVGEVVSPSLVIVSLMPDAKLEIKVNVSEDNVVKLGIGNHARIELDAFSSGDDFSGTVSEIDPAGTLIGGAVYYTTTIFFDTDYPGIRAGMSANVWIETASSSDALVIPISALDTTATSTSVRVLEGGVPVRRDVTAGIRSEEGKVEIRSGLAAGDRVVTGP